MAKRSAAVGKRQNVIKYPTPVQGPRAYVIFSKPTWGEIRAAVDIVRDRTKEYVSAVAAIKAGKKVAVKDKAKETETALSDTLWEFACDKFQEWNWVNDDGEPLGDLPQMDLDNLYGDEVQAIFAAIQELYMMSEADEDSEGN